MDVQHRWNAAREYAMECSGLKYVSLGSGGVVPLAAGLPVEFVLPLLDGAVHFVALHPSFEFAPLIAIRPGEREPYLVSFGGAFDLQLVQGAGHLGPVRLQAYA